MSKSFKFVGTLLKDNTGSACGVKLMGASSGFGVSLDSNFFRQ